MSFESYAHHILQKHRLAIAIAVLKDKPKSISIQSYLEGLRNKINDIDSQLTVCSEDFDLDDDDIINDNNDLSCKSNITIIEQVGNPIVSNNDKSLNEVTICSQESVSILKDVPVNNLGVNNDKSSNRSISILKDAVINDIRITDNDMTVTQESISLLKQANDDKYKHLDLNELCKNDNVNTIHKKTITQVNETQDSDNTQCETQLENVENYSYNIGLIPNEKHINNEVDVDNSNVTTQNYTHISQSQYDNIIINENLFKKVNSDIQAENHIVIPENLHIPTTNEYRNKTFCNHNQMDVDSQEIDYKYNATEISQTIEKQSLEIHHKSVNEHNDRINENNDDVNENNDITINENNDMIDENNDNSQSELIPFKVIEELNKVKSYLNRNVDRRMSNDGSMDSGYKSDSQSKSSFKNSSQCSVTHLNQSGHCLFDFIVNAPLLVNAQEICNEIAQVLGQLIDKLHEEEKYLGFLDELLDKVDCLLQEILNGGGCDEGLLLGKDEDINRLLLLNISNNIQIFTIGKIIKILENILPRLTSNENIYEITYTVQSENLSYIFHILEVLLKKYVKKKDNLTSKLSQSDLKKSSITDIWKKKWNPNFKSSEIEEIVPRSCVLTKCSEVLNKLIVDCMGVYSLISYSALQCFNALQL